MVSRSYRNRKREIINRRPKEREAQNADGDAGHRRRDDFSELLNAKGKANTDQAAYGSRAQNGAQYCLSANLRREQRGCVTHGSDEREARALDGQQAGSEKAEALNLNEGRDP